MLELKTLAAAPRATSRAYRVQMHIAHAQCELHWHLFFMMDMYKINIDNCSVMQQLFLQLVWAVALSQTPPLLSVASQPSSSFVLGTHSSPWGCATRCTT